MENLSKHKSVCPVLMYICFTFLHDVMYSHTSGKSKTDGKLHRTIYINFTFSTVCSLSTMFCAITFPLRGVFGWIPIFDFAVSSICLCLMMGSNRRFCVHLTSCTDGCARKCIKPVKNTSRDRVNSTTAAVGSPGVCHPVHCLHVCCVRVVFSNRCGVEYTQFGSD